MGPLQLFVIGFEAPTPDGRVIEALLDASDSGVVRIVDFLGVYKDPEGEVVAAELSELSLDEAMTYGAWVGGLIGLGMGGEEAALLGAEAGALISEQEYEYGLDEEALESIAADIPAGGAALLVVLEHTWAIPLRDALRSQGGILIAQDFLNPETLIALGAMAAPME